MLWVLFIVNKIYVAFGLELTVTRGLEFAPNSLEDSLHYDGLALDFRTRDASLAIRKEIANTAKNILGKDYDVILETTHMHIEYHPKG